MTTLNLSTCWTVFGLVSSLLFSCQDRSGGVNTELPTTGTEVRARRDTTSFLPEFGYEPGSKPSEVGYVTVEVNGEVQKVYYERHGDLDLVDGDIIIRDRNASPDKKKGLLGHIRVGRAWPDGNVPYVISTALSNNATLNTNVMEAIKHWEAVTPIRFIKRTKEEDYIEFRIGSKPSIASSDVGMMGDDQYIYLGTATIQRNAIHEIGHAVGLYHEHTRRDRNGFITVQWNNITRADSSHFIIQLGRPIGPYDFASQMHYDGNARAINRRKPTMVPVDSTNVIANGGFLSRGDIAAIDTLYPGLARDRVAMARVRVTGRTGQ